MGWIYWTTLAVSVVAAVWFWIKCARDSNGYMREIRYLRVCFGEAATRRDTLQRLYSALQAEEKDASRAARIAGEVNAELRAERDELRAALTRCRQDLHTIRTLGSDAGLHAATALGRSPHEEARDDA